MSVHGGSNSHTTMKKSSQAERHMWHTKKCQYICWCGCDVHRDQTTFFAKKGRKTCLHSINRHIPRPRAPRVRARVGPQDELCAPPGYGREDELVCVRGRWGARPNGTGRQHKQCNQAQTSMKKDTTTAVMSNTETHADNARKKE